MQSTKKQFNLSTILIAFPLLFGSHALAQIIVSGPMIVSGYFQGAANITAGGSILVNSGGNWDFNGNITSADKGNANAPTATGRTETITFDGAGTYTNASSYIVDGYAAASNQTSAFVLPVGSGTTAYPVTVPTGASVTAAYFSGSGSTQTVTISYNTGTSTVYSPYIDLPSGFPFGSYTFSYPAGFGSSSYSALLSSGNSSANGTAEVLLIV